MADLLRESALGQIIRFASRNKMLQYPEEEPNFKIPWEQAAVLEKEKEIEAASPPVLTPPAPVADGEAEPPLSPSRQQSLAQIPTVAPERTRTNATGPLAPVVSIARTKTREQTTPWTAERYDVERMETAERAESAIIQPQVTEAGITLVDWYTTDDPANPQNWSTRKKLFVVFQIFVYTFAVYAGSAIYTSSEPQVMARFHVGQSKASLPLSMYVLGYGFGPMIFSPLSEIPLFGRNVPYIVSLALFVILCVPTALVENYAGLLVLRFLTGFMGSPCLATGGATMQDMYSLLKLPYALTAWVAAAFAAPALGPLLSGFAVTAKNWRWSLWEIIWMAGPVFALMFVGLPETSPSNILLRRARRLRQLTGNQNLRSQSEIDQGNKSLSSVVYDSLVIPIKICLQDPAVLFTNVYTSVMYGIYYSFFEAFPIVYVGIYGFNLGELGIVFTCIVAACIVGVIVYCSYVYFYLEPDILKHGLRAQEHRLVPALGAVFLLPAALFWFGWTAEPSIHWMVSIVGIAFFALGAFIVLQCIFMYLPLTYPPYAASLFAANDLCRSAMAAGCIIWAHPLYVNLGIGRGISLLGGLMVGGVIGIWLIWWFGAKLRARSRFALS